MKSDSTCLIVTGASGRLGRLLRTAWRLEPVAGLRILIAGRQKGADIQWDMLQDPAPDWPSGAVVLHLAGVTRGTDDALACNARLVAPLVQALRRNAARGVLFVSTAAVYAPSDRPSQETTPPDPPAAYGQSKLLAEQTFLSDPPPCPVCILRLANVPGADALLGPRPPGQPVRLDPVPGRDGGPLRSWIGPITLARALAALALRIGADPLPPILNLAQEPPLTMGALLAASGRDWAYGPPRDGVIPTATLSAALLQQLIPLPDAQAATILAELARLEAAA